MEREEISLSDLDAVRSQLAEEGRTIVWVAVDGKAVGLIAIADAPRPTSKQAVSALREAGIEVVMLTGDNEATARRIASELGITSVIAEVLPGQKAEKVAELQRGGRKVAMVGDDMALDPGIGT